MHLGADAHREVAKLARADDNAYAPPHVLAALAALLDGRNPTQMAAWVRPADVPDMDRFHVLGIVGSALLWIRADSPHGKPNPPEGTDVPMTAEMLPLRTVRSVTVLPMGLDRFSGLAFQAHWGITLANGTTIDLQGKNQREREAFDCIARALLNVLTGQA